MRVSTESETIKRMGIQNDNPTGPEGRIRAAVFFFIFFGVLLAIGGWLTYTFGLADARSPLQMVGLSLGLLNLASAAVPLWFALAIIRQILRQRKHAN